MNTIQTSIKEFIRHCRFEKSLSSKTIKAYSTDLTQLTKFLIEKNYSTTVTEITKVELRNYLEIISVLKPKSIKRKIATIKAMFNFLEFEDLIIVNPLRKMRIKIKEPRSLPKVMSAVEIKKILKIAFKKIASPAEINSYSYLYALQQVVVIELLFATGARVSEIANLKTENINVVTGEIVICGKGNKERIMQVCNSETLQILKEYNHLFKERIVKSEGYFLVNRLGKKISDQSIRSIVKHLAIKAGIKRQITPHTYRHSFATLLLEKDVDIKYIQSLLGHSSIMTTQIYTHVNREKQKQILKTKHPRRDFFMIQDLVS